jgi:lactosylceramide 4-alpha-galactosyltransferase
MNFAWDGIGHEVADMCVEELRSNFRGDDWIHNGPALITRVLKRMCNSSNVSHRAVGETWSLATTIYSYMTS